MSKREIIQQEALDMAIKHKRCGLGISMGVGKTLIGLKYIDHFRKDNKLRVLVVAPKLSIFESWKDDGTKFDINVDDLEFTTYLSLNKFNPNNYDLVVLDECHSLLPSSNEFLESFDECGRDYYIHLEGTSEADEDEMEELLEEEGHDWLFENNYDSWDCEHFFGLPLIADEVDPDNRYNTRF